MRILALASILAASPVLGEVQVLGHINSYLSERLETGAGVSVNIGKEVYVWGSAERTYGTRVTQSLGKIDLLGVGLGFRKTFGVLSPFIEAGVYHPSYSVRPIIQSEVVYYSFEPTFGRPPFQGPTEYFTDLNNNYSVQSGVGISFGVQYEATPNMLVEIRVRSLGLKETFRQWSPRVNGGPIDGDFAACGCLWEGSNDWRFNGVSLGGGYKF